MTATQPEPQPLDTWAIVEALGHRTLAGKLTETTIAGPPMLSVLRMDGRQQYLPPASVYMITPCTLQEANAVARRNLWNGLPGGMLAIGPPDDGDPDPWAGDPLAGDDEDPDDDEPEDEDDDA
jgi:hypothetical protein